MEVCASVMSVISQQQCARCSLLAAVRRFLGNCCASSSRLLRSQSGSQSLRAMCRAMLCRADRNKQVHKCNSKNGAFIVAIAVVIGITFAPFVMKGAKAMKLAVDLQAVGGVAYLTLSKPSRGSSLRSRKFAQIISINPG
eukprot:COSAG01_NODE_5662_length_4113_cov_3.017190_8_plen_140_part_00